MTLSEGEKKFWNGFLDLYRSLPHLWWDNADILRISNRDNYRMNTLKSKQKLLLYVKQRCPNADLAFVQRKIHNFRCGFHREYRKKQKLEAIGKVHRPMLWYYKKLLFLVDDENAMDLIDNDTDDTNSVYLKEYENSYSILNSGTITETNETSEQIMNMKVEVEIEEDVETLEQDQDYQNVLNETTFIEMIPSRTDNDDLTDKESTTKFNETEINRIPEIIKLNMTRELASTSSNSQMLLNADKLKSVKRKLEKISEEDNQVSITVKPKKIKLNDIYNLVERAITQTELQPKEDMFDVIGRKIANDLREMTRDQRIFADKIINDVIYHGKSNNLTSTFYFSPSV